MRAFCALCLGIGGCAQSPPALTRAQPAVDPPAAVSCDDALLYQTADAHPEIRWISPRPGVPGNVALSCILGSDADDGTIEMKAYMSSGLYRFLRECRPEENVVHRLFQYKNSARPYLLRLHTTPHADPKTYLIVSSYRKPAGNTQHLIAQSSNDASRMTLCPPAAQSAP
jgi:hypothetical protein